MKIKDRDNRPVIETENGNIVKLKEMNVKFGESGTMFIELDVIEKTLVNTEIESKIQIGSEVSYRYYFKEVVKDMIKEQIKQNLDNRDKENEQ